MRLWLLRPVKDWSPWYDRAFGFVVRAEDAACARKAITTAKEKWDFGSGDEGEAVWLDETKTSCVELTVDGPQEVIMRDFRAA